MDRDVKGARAKAAVDRGVKEILQYPNLDRVCRLVGLTLGAFLLLSIAFGVITFKWISPFWWVSAFHLFVYGCLIIMAELRFEFLLAQALFLRGYTGRGLLYLFIATGIPDLGIFALFQLIAAVIFFSVGLLNLLIGWAESN